MTPTPRSGSVASGMFDRAAEQADDIDAPSLAQQGEAEPGRALRADEVDGGRKAAGFLQKALAGIGIGGVDRRRSAGVERGLPLRRVDVRDDRADAVEGARQVDGGEPEPAGPDDEQRVVRIDRRRLFEGAIGDEAGTGEGRGEGLGQRVELDQISWMVDEDVVAEPPVALDSEVPRPRAKILLAGSAHRTLPATAPSVDDPVVADLTKKSTSLLRGLQSRPLVAISSPQGKI